MARTRNRRTRNNHVRRSKSRSVGRSRTRRSEARRSRARRSEARRVTRRNRSTGPRRRMVRSQETSGFDVVPQKRKTQKRKKAPSKYNKFMQRMSPILRRDNPNVRQPEIMKMIARKWKEQNN
tara:strand:+ start:202 stop:570 length:369 start_codon:yes stop_codon:yes gene_type:complete